MLDILAVLSENKGVRCYRSNTFCFTIKCGVQKICIPAYLYKSWYSCCTAIPLG